MLAEKLLEAAGNSTQPTYIEDVFSTYLYTGNGSTQSIVNGIDLAGKGGLTWIKIRNTAYVHVLTDTARGVSKYLDSSTTGAQSNTSPYGLTSFNADGFSLKDDSPGNYGVNGNGYTFASWTFRKQPKFFDVVTYTGNGSAPRAISHSLGSVPGCIIIKKTSSTGNWWTFHRSAPNQGVAYPGIGGNLYLDATDAADSGANPFLSAVDSTTFTLSTNQNTAMNASGATYVAYIFAHNAGGFGLTGTDNVISCGSFTASGAGAATVNLGYEPQWVLLKPSNSTGGAWLIFDNMRGWTVSGDDEYLRPNTSAAAGSYDYGEPTATGFNLKNGAGGLDYIYIAIRRGPMKVPTDGTKVFKPSAATPSGGLDTVTTGFPTDFLITTERSHANTGQTFAFDRLRGGDTSKRVYLTTNTTNAETNATGGSFGLDSNVAVYDNFYQYSGITTPVVYWNFRRAPSFFDISCGTTNGSGTLLVNHNLGVPPELIFVKDRQLTTSWYVLRAGTTEYMLLNSTAASGGGLTIVNTSTQFGNNGNNANSNQVVYMWATCAGVSKVGSYTGNGTTQTINCGFAGGARFVLIKRTDSTGDWYVWDTARGIISGNDPHLSLNTTSAEVTTDDTIDPDSTGFVVNQLSATNVNVSSATYIYLAIA